MPHASLAHFFFLCIFLIQFLVIKWYLFYKTLKVVQRRVRVRLLSVACCLICCRNQRTHKEWKRERKGLRAKAVWCHGRELTFSSLPQSRVLLSGSSQWAACSSMLGFSIQFAGQGKGAASCRGVLAHLKHAILKLTVSYWNPNLAGFHSLCPSCASDGVEQPCSLLAVKLLWTQRC